MKSKLLILALTLLLLTSLCACGNVEIPPLPTLEPSPTPIAEVDIGGLKVAADADSLSLEGVEFDFDELTEVSDVLSSLKSIDLGSTKLDMEQIEAIKAAYPESEVKWKVELDGKEIDSEESELDLGHLYGDDDVSEICAALHMLPKLEYINTVGENGYTMLSSEKLTELAEAAPNATLKVNFTLYGLEADENTEELRYNRDDLGNESIAVFRSVLPFLKSLKLLRICECGVSDYDSMQSLKDDFPEVNVVWSVDIAGYPFMTDTTLINTNLLNNQTAQLTKYMKDVMYLDVGHDQDLTDMSFVRNFPKLTTVIVSLTHIEDISPFADCPEIEFFECFTTPISDISVLAGMEKLEYVNLGNMWNLDDLSPLYGKETLKLVRICDGTFDHVTWDEVEALRESVPNCVVNTDGGHSANSGGWRYNKDGTYTERYALLREQMLYDEPYWELRMYNSPSAEEG